MQYSLHRLLRYTPIDNEMYSCTNNHDIKATMGNTKSTILPLSTPKKITADMCQTYIGTYDCGHTKIMVALLCNTDRNTDVGKTPKHMGKLCGRCVLNKESKKNQAGAGWETSAES